MCPALDRGPGPLGSGLGFCPAGSVPGDSGQCRLVSLAPRASSQPWVLTGRPDEVPGPCLCSLTPTRTCSLPRGFGSRRLTQAFTNTI